MPSPFPGMNPYLEYHPFWREFHRKFISTAHTFLVARLQPRYTVHFEPTLYIHEPPADDRRLLGEGDLGVGPGAGGRGESVAARAAPVYGALPSGVEVEEIDRIEIRDRYGRDLITVVELLSPTNKYAGDDREYYLGKRREVLRSRSHFVEIDLLRGGPRLPLRGLPPCDYCAVVSRVEERPGRVGIWPWRMRDPMPTLPIPLRGDDRDADLDLKTVLDRTYDDARYGDYIYTHTPEPRLSADDAAWAAQFVPQPPARQEP